MKYLVIPMLMMLAACKPDDMTNLNDRTTIGCLDNVQYWFVFDRVGTVQAMALRIDPKTLSAVNCK